MKLVWMIALVDALAAQDAAARIIEMASTGGMAFDQPRVAIEVVDTSGAQTRSLGPEPYNECILDTGATSVLVAGIAASTLEESGIVSAGQYRERGVAGEGVFDVSAAYRFDYAGSDGERLSFDAVHFMYSKELDLGSLAGIVGMPGMVGRVVALDQTVWLQTDDLTFMSTTFRADLPAPLTPRLEVPLTFVEFPREGQVEPDDALPIWTTLPFVEVKASATSNVSGAYALDTGAQISILSSDVARTIGLDKDGDGTFDQEKLDEIDVAGIGGTITIPLLNVDTLEIEATDGTVLRWRDVVVGILDIDPAIKGVFGMDLLTAGWFAHVFEGAPPGSIYKVHFDFRKEGEGAMYFDMKPE